MLIVGQKITFQSNFAYQRQIIPIRTRFSGGAFQGGSGERLHGMQEVTGSIPLFSTKKALYFVGSMVLFFLLWQGFGAHEKHKKPLPFVGGAYGEGEKTKKAVCGERFKHQRADMNAMSSLAWSRMTSSRRSGISRFC